ncbi:DUF2778 domain-containing protein [Cupriavidus sp. SW-Y-13]|uniref:DUF2778 domain-containing protein n=1 Tax=Cupriavidus sp. SW-Y-13 TaxID=2653854 RepID=UPI001365D9F4|nr:DUF2778 domain-containing protein [Cupriavidus sp. SW-Y-13]
MAVVTNSLVWAIERDPTLRKALVEAHREKFGLVAGTTDVRLMVEMLGLAETARRMDRRNASLEFDGQFLRWIERGMVSRAWIAVSGKKDYNDKTYQFLRGVGPLPAGDYVARQSELQRWENYSLLDRRVCVLRWIGVKKFTGAWPGCAYAWGTRRVWLEPRSWTVTLGRDNFSIHGGKEPGSAGCIDLTSGMPDFVDYFLKYGKNMDLRVRY